MTSPPGSLPSFGDRYRVERELGRGGMATVYLCTDIKFERQVAIKLLHPDLAAAVGADRFHREIKIATGLSHPGILPAFDSGQTADGNLFYVMPYVEGESLRDRLEREQQLSVEAAVRITTQVASALQYAHGRGIVHRDIKPENILLQGDQAVVADFGIARAAASATDGAALTQTGVSIGTPTYMSPEQGMGERKIDGRSDQYSLACVIYELLTGQPPFVASSLQMLVMKHVGEPAPLISTVRPSVPEELEDVILRALEKVPADRWPTVGEFGDALNGVVATTGTWSRHTGTRTAQMRSTRERRTTKPPMPRSRQFAFAAGAVAMLFAIGMLAWKWNTAGRTSDANADRIAVLYFRDESRDSTLRDLADGLTESLIERLSDVPALTVVSQNGVLPFRGKATSPDSIARAFGVGSIVEGSVERIARGVAINIRLLSAEGDRLDNKSFEFDSARTRVTDVADSLAEQVALFLRERIGDVSLRQRKRETRSNDAWLFVQRAERRRKEADSLVLAGVLAPALDALEDADSLLARATASDAAWPAPPALRASVALAKARALPRESTALGAIVDSGLTHAEAALAIDARNADALEYKGKLLYFKINRHLVTEPREFDRVLEESEAALTLAVTVNKNQAGAWDELSALHYRKPDLLEVIRAAEKAYEADAYLRSARTILNRLFLASYNLELFPEAMKKLKEFQRRFPNDPFGIEGRLLMYRAKGQKIDIDSAWTYLEEYVRRSPEANRTFVRKKGEILVAGALAQAAISMKDPNLADSSRNVLMRARVPERTFDPRRDLPANEASVRVLLGDYDEAVALLKDYLTVNPDHRRGFVNRTGWWWRDLQTYPKFKALVAGL